MFAAGRLTAAPGVVLHQTHCFNNETHVDTLRTYVTATHVRVSHVAGDVILALPADRISVLDAGSHQFTQMALSQWEQKLRDAADAATVDERLPPRFEAAGEPALVAGIECQPYLLYTRRELIPGEVDYVQQLLWVAEDLEMPKGAYETYLRSIRVLASVGLGVLVEWPPGVVLMSETVTRPENEGRAATAELETTVVFQIEHKDLPDSTFAIPADYKRASADTDQ